MTLRRVAARVFTGATMHTLERRPDVGDELEARLLDRLGVLRSDHGVIIEWHAHRTTQTLRVTHPSGSQPPRPTERLAWCPGRRLPAHAHAVALTVVVDHAGD